MTIPTLLQTETAELLSAITHTGGLDRDRYEIVETRISHLKRISHLIEEGFRSGADELRQFQCWFRQESDPVFGKSVLMSRARTWPEGYPGDHVTVDAIYGNMPLTPDGIGNYLDRYFLSRTLAIAVRSRLRKLCSLLQDRCQREGEGGNWLNLGCGSCCELLSCVELPHRTIWCVDADQKALECSRTRLEQSERGRATIHFLKENALRFVNADRNIRRCGRFTTIYSAGLFDYLPNSVLATLMNALYNSLQEDGVLIATFKDASRYETFDYHWLVNWNSFLQRSEEECLEVISDSGIPLGNLNMERDESGVILFFVARK
jgi:extracellular factor (EF) 3-hydroxypalmitic acid methyl ester biosynthesis protein